MNWFQKLMIKFFGWNYTHFLTLSDVWVVDRYYIFPSGKKFVKTMKSRGVGLVLMKDDKTIEGEPRYNGDYVKWDYL